MARNRSITSVGEAQRIARRRVPRSVYHYIEGGTEAEFTVRDNRRAFEEVTFRLAHRGADLVWGLAAAGEPGVTSILEMLRDGIDRTLALLGCPSVAALDRSYLNVPPGWGTHLR